MIQFQQALAMRELERRLLTTETLEAKYGTG
jgi:hypothetical protein